MMEITLMATDVSKLQAALLRDDVEHCAVLFASPVTRSDGGVRLLVRGVELPEPEDYSAQGECEAELRPDYVARMSKHAKREGLSLIFAHSHPGSSAPRFSGTDDAGEEHLARFLSMRCPGVIHGALVISAGGLRARQLGTEVEARVVQLGENRTILFDPDRAAATATDQFDRQVRAFGERGQRALQSLRIAIVGLGGTGSIIAQQLAHLGVRAFVLIDPDVVEASNLNRVVGATAVDVTHPKVEVAAASIRHIAPEARVNALQGDVTHTRTARAMIDADFIFGCTDSHGSRAVLQQVCYQYLIPGIDMGSTIIAAEGAVSGVFGRVQALTPGLACLQCSALLDPEQVRRDMMSPFERQADPYISGEPVPAPAVISINGTVSSLAVTMFMAMITGIPSRARHLIYNALSASLRSVRASPATSCYICSSSGALARGDSVALFARDD